MRKKQAKKFKTVVQLAAIAAVAMSPVRVFAEDTETPAEQVQEVIEQTEEIIASVDAGDAQDGVLTETQNIVQDIQSDIQDELPNASDPEGKDEQIISSLDLQTEVVIKTDEGEQTVSADEVIGEEGILDEVIEDLVDVEKDIQDAIDQLDQAKDTAEQHQNEVDQANQAVEDAISANTDTETALNDGGVIVNDYLTQMDNASTLSEAKGYYEQAQSARDQAMSEVGVAQNAYDDALARYETALANMDPLAEDFEQQIAEAKQSVEDAKAKLAEVTVKAENIQSTVTTLYEKYVEMSKDGALENANEILDLENEIASSDVRDDAKLEQLFTKIIENYYYPIDVAEEGTVIEVTNVEAVQPAVAGTDTQNYYLVTYTVTKDGVTETIQSYLNYETKTAVDQLLINEKELVAVTKDTVTTQDTIYLVDGIAYTLDQLLADPEVMYKEDGTLVKVTSEGEKTVYIENGTETGVTIPLTDAIFTQDDLDGIQVNKKTVTKRSGTTTISDVTEGYIEAIIDEYKPEFSVSTLDTRKTKQILTDTETIVYYEDEDGNIYKLVYADVLETTEVDRDFSVLNYAMNWHEYKRNGSQWDNTTRNNERNQFYTDYGRDAFNAFRDSVPTTDIAQNGMDEYDSLTMTRNSYSMDYYYMVGNSITVRVDMERIDLANILTPEQYAEVVEPYYATYNDMTYAEQSQVRQTMARYIRDQLYNSGWLALLPEYIDSINDQYDDNNTSLGFRFYDLNDNGETIYYDAQDNTDTGSTSYTQVAVRYDNSTGRFVFTAANNLFAPYFVFDVIRDNVTDARNEYLDQSAELMAQTQDEVLSFLVNQTGLDELFWADRISTSSSNSYSTKYYMLDRYRLGGTYTMRKRVTTNELISSTLVGTSQVYDPVTTTTFDEYEDAEFRDWVRMEEKMNYYGTLTEKSANLLEYIQETDLALDAVLNEMNNLKLNTANAMPAKLDGNIELREPTQKDNPVTPIHTPTEQVAVPGTSDITNTNNWYISLGLSAAVALLLAKRLRDED